MTKEEYKKELLAEYKDNFGSEEPIEIDAQYFMNQYNNKTLAIVFSNKSGEAVDEAYSINELADLFNYCEDHYND